MEWLFENSVPTLVTGSILTALAASAYWQTGQRIGLVAAGLGALLTAGLCAMEWLIVTPGELVADRIHALAADLERNQPERVLAYISPRAPDLIDHAKRVLAEVTVLDAVVKRNLRVEAVPGTGVAKATFNAVVVVDAPKHELTNYRHARVFELNFRFESGQWLISDFHERSPVGSPNPP